MMVTSLVGFVLNDHFGQFENHKYIIFVCMANNVFLIGWSSHNDVSLLGEETINSLAHQHVMPFSVLFMSFSVRSSTTAANDNLSLSNESRQREEATVKWQMNCNQVASTAKNSLYRFCLKEAGLLVSADIKSLTNIKSVSLADSMFPCPFDGNQGFEQSDSWNHNEHCEKLSWCYFLVCLDGISEYKWSF